jgi:hypothetical protein
MKRAGAGPLPRLDREEAEPVLLPMLDAALAEAGGGRHGWIEVPRDLRVGVDHRERGRIAGAPAAQRQAWGLKDRLRVHRRPTMDDSAVVRIYPPDMRGKCRRTALRG